jgi:hypothetical protein
VVVATAAAQAGTVADPPAAQVIAVDLAVGEEVEFSPLFDHLRGFVDSRTDNAYIFPLSLTM